VGNASETLALPLRADAHRHQDIKKRRLDFYHARTHFIDQIEKNLVFGQIAQWRHQEFRIKSDGKIASFVSDGKGFLGFADLRGVGGDLDVVLTKVEFDRVRLFAGEQGNAPQRIQESLALERDALFRL